MAGEGKQRGSALKAARQRARRARERRRLRKLLALESSLWENGATLIAGVDEVGRGPLAGPVVAAAVIMPPRVAIRGIDDSKKLNAEQRETLAREIWEKALSIGIGAASCREIDRINILRASHLAMQRALSRLGSRPEHILIDGPAVPVLGEHTSVIDGDAKVHCIACASVIAKVTRDRLMRKLAPRYPQFGWEHNAGYATAEHRSALDAVGPTPHHRRSFMSVQLSLELLAEP